MEDYKEMYYTLFNKVTDVIEQLQAAQQKTEDLFLSNEGEKRNTEQG